ncbi:MAG: hypothetical protein AAB908_02540 [Patescibacteria group bacterium]
MSEEDGFKKNVKKLVDNLGEAMMEGREKIRVLNLSGEEVSKVLDMDDSEIEDFVAEKGFDFDEHYIRLKTPRAESEGYMKSPEDIKNWLKATNLN